MGKATEDGKRRGARLKARAEKVGVSVQTLATACGITPAGVYNWFATGRIKKEHLPILAALLNCRIEELLSDEARITAEEGRADWSVEAQTLATLFDTLEPAKRRAAWPLVVRMLAQTQGLLELFLPFPTANVQLKVRQFSKPDNRKPTKKV